ncbi:MAG: SDR family oxidoreductase [Anaerolineae bacterium]|nr:MAG: SDR family oxidoreductase [Anaerolineae bacterium]
MQLLILGGTRFLGRALVQAALQRGHEVTLFNRGQSNPDLFPDLEKLRGDRDGGLGALDGRRWEAVVDTCGYVPRVVRQSAELLADAVGHYTFISTLSVYADLSQRGIGESAPLGTLEDESVEEITGQTYGPLKALCEMVVAGALPGRALIIRPGLIVGPHDPTDRFTYWPDRVAQGGEVLAPGRSGKPVQFIDVRDLAEWTIRLAEKKRNGVHNATGPEVPLPMEQLLHTCQVVSGGDATLTWVSGQFLLDHEVEPWSDLPLWTPESDPAFAGFHAFDCRKAIAAGLTFRPLADTVRDTLAWAATRLDDHEWRAGLTRDRESELLQAWHSP